MIDFSQLLLRFLSKVYWGFAMGNQKSSTQYAFKVFCVDKLECACKPPLPRSGHRVVCDSRNMYSFGGYNPLIMRHDDDIEYDQDDFSENTFPLFQELWKYNYATRCWKRCRGRNTFPEEVASNAVIREGNYLMVYACVFGGTGSPFGSRCSNQLYILNLGDDRGCMFEVQATGQHPTPQYGQALVYHNNFLYTIGGTNGFAYSCDIHRLNMKKKEWESVYIGQGLSDIEPEGRYRHEVAFDGCKIYLLGGGTSDEAFDFFEVPIFDIETRQWTKVRTKRDPKVLTLPEYASGIPPPRRCHGAVQVDVVADIHIFVSGGYDGDLVFDDLWRLELSTMQWTLIEQCVFPRPVYFHSASVTPEGKMFAFGGIYGGEDIERSNDIYATWLCIPKLSEMCWEALLHYNPAIFTCSKDRLIDMGLPKRFIQRLE